MQEDKKGTRKVYVDLQDNCFSKGGKKSGSHIKVSSTLYYSFRTAKKVLETSLLSLMMLILIQSGYL